MPEINFFANHKVHLMSLAMRGFFISEFHSASHAHINESLSVSEPEKCRYRWRPLSGGFSVRQAHFLKGKDAMNNFVEITSRIGRMYQDFLISGKGAGDIIEEIDKLSAELRRNGCVNSIFFETLLKQGFMFDSIRLI